MTITIDTPPTPKTIQFADLMVGDHFLYTLVGGGNQFVGIKLSSDSWLFRNLAFAPNVAFQTEKSGFQSSPQRTITRVFTEVSLA